MRPDPPVRADGRCSQCGKPRYPKHSRKYGGVVAELDPFCSRVCAEAWHGTTETERGFREGVGRERANVGSGLRPADLPSRSPAVPRSVSVGLCHCGCGQPTNLAPKNNKSKGYVRGQPMRFLPHHNVQPKKPH